MHRGDASIAQPELTRDHLQGLAHLIAQSTSQQISEEKPLLSATLPSGYRVQVIFPPACADGGVAMSIRKQATLQMTLDTYEQLGAFAMTKTLKGVHDPMDDILGDLYARGDVKSFITKAVQFKKNIIVSGGTSTGKRPSSTPRLPRCHRMNASSRWRMRAR